MNVQETVETRVSSMICEINSYINLLYITPCFYTRNMILNQLRDKLSMLYFLISLEIKKTMVLPTTTALPIPGQLPQNIYTIDELSKYNGKDGNPAYVAVDGIVYDVTEAPGWAAATHFRLTAGHDLTMQFRSCHNGQKVLEKLKAIGRLRQ